MPDLNGSTTTLHWIDLATNKTIQLTRPFWGIHDHQFYWIINNTILFLSNRASSGLYQLFPLNLPDNVLAMRINRQAIRFAFSCQVYTNLSIQQIADRQAVEKTSGSLVYKFDKLFLRHWDEYVRGSRHHPLIVSIERNANGIFYFISEPKDVLFSIDSDSSTRPSGYGKKTQWLFSASGNKFAFTSRYDEKNEAVWSTNLDIFTVDLTTSDLQPMCITCPSYSPTDDQVLVYRLQSVLDYESDQFKVKLYNGFNSKITLLNNWDYSIQAITWSLDVITSLRAVTNHNTNLLSKVRKSTQVETFNFTGAKNKTVWGWHVPPANGTAQKTSLVFLIHGGSQNRYAIIAINFHESNSYGQKFTDSITGQYGTLPYGDLKLGLSTILTRYKYIDENQAVALGACYGGYMINWIAGHPEMSQRFKAFICHADVTITSYENPEAFEKFNPISHVANWSQPMLTIHGGRDYRVLDTQGISAFTALQRGGIPSRMLYFPKENHSILNSFNSMIWYQEVLDWMNKWTT
ncbi:unnamed protein product [Rotaria sp. Silwood1]|nr:unnamed protein product [Rotaria sp. Silwood1]